MTTAVETEKSRARPAATPGAPGAAPVRAGTAQRAPAPGLAPAKRSAQPHAAAPAASAATDDLKNGNLLLRLQACTLAHTRFEDAAVALCTELASILDASRVSLGLVAHHHSDLAAVSQGGRDKLDPATIKVILAAMDESFDQAGTIVAPGQGRRINRAAEQLRRLQHGQVLTVPMAVDSMIIGALTVEISDPRRPIGPVAALCEDATMLFAPVLRVLKLNERPWWRRLLDDARDSASLWSSPARRPWRWLLGVALAVTLVLSLVPMTVTVGAPARVEGAIQRPVTAPTSGFLKTALVRPGDVVKKGQLLAEMQDRDLQLDRSKLLSEAAQHENAYAASMARADRSNMMIAQAKLSEARAQLSLIEQQLGRIQLQSPIDGVVIQGDLTQMVGAPLEKGQSLMTVAPHDAFRVIVELDERDILYLKKGQSGHLSLSALPWDNTEVQVARITPMTTVIDGRNVYEIEATPQAGASLRPGLRGVVRIDVGRAPPLRVWVRRIADHLKRLWWRWAP